MDVNDRGLTGTLALLAVLAAVPASAAPPDVPSAQAFDVAGLRIGQDMDSAIASLKSQGYLVSIITQGYKGVEGPPKPLKLTGTKEGDRRPIKSDKVVVWLSYPPDRPRVLGVYRGFDYEGEGAPTATAIMDAGKEKARFEIQRRRLDKGTVEQVIRWRPDGRKVGAVAKLFSNLPGTETGTEGREPCLKDFLTSGRTSPVLPLYKQLGGPPPQPSRRPRETGEDGGGSEFNEMLASSFYPKPALKDYNFRIYEGWFAPLPNCGTVYASTIDHDGGGFAKHARLLLVAQSDMYRNASAYHDWLGARSADYQQQRLKNAGKPEI